MSIEKVFRIPFGLVHLVEGAIEQIRREHDAGTIPPFCYDGTPEWRTEVRVLLTIDDPEAGHG